jgi:hypothetical protein
LYTASGPGGTDVGPFSQNFTIPQPLTWTNQDSIGTVDRSTGLDVTWTGGDPNGTVQITDENGLICNAKISDQHFTIPAFALLSVAPTSGTSTSGLVLGAVSTTALAASGISSGTINSVVLIGKTVTYE